MGAEKERSGPHGNRAVDDRRSRPARVALLCQPFIPGSANKLLDLLAVPAESRDFVHVHANHALVPGTALPVPEGVFPRYVEQPDANV